MNAAVIDSCFRKSTKRVSVVIVTYNRLHLLVKLLRQLEVQTLKPDEVIIIDNDVNQSSKIVTEIFTKDSALFKVTYFPNEVNSLTGGRNLGVSKVKTEFTCLLDDDVQIEVNFLEKLFKAINELPDAIAVQGKITISDKSVIKNYLAWFSGQFFLSKKNCKVRRTISATYPARYEGLKPLRCEWLSGSNQLYRTEILSAVKWDEKLLAYCDGEDLDHSLRVYRSNLGNLYFIPDARIMHLASSESRTFGYEATLMREIYSYYLLKKLFRSDRRANLVFCFNRLFMLLINFSHIPISGFSRFRINLALDYLKALRVVFQLRRQLESGYLESSHKLLKLK